MLKTVKTASRGFDHGLMLLATWFAIAPRGDDETPSYYARCAVHHHDSRLPKQAEPDDSCLMFVAAERRVQGKGIGSWRLTSKSRAPRG